jgi:hypothetical protein
MIIIITTLNEKNTTVPLTGREDLYGCEMLRSLYCLYIRLTDGSEIVSLTLLLRSSPQKHFVISASGIRF